MRLDFWFLLFWIQQTLLRKLVGIYETYRTLPQILPPSLGRGTTSFCFETSQAVSGLITGILSILYKFSIFWDLPLHDIILG